VNQAPDPNVDALTSNYTIGGTADWRRQLALGKRSEEDRRFLGRTLRERVAASHSVETWADAVLEAAA
jgi:hypothetical protein